MRTPTDEELNAMAAALSGRLNAVALRNPDQSVERALAIANKTRRLQQLRDEAEPIWKDLKEMRNE